MIFPTDSTAGNSHDKLASIFHDKKTLKIKTFCQTEQWNVANDPLLVKVMNFTDDCDSIVGMGDSAFPSIIMGRPSVYEKRPPHKMLKQCFCPKSVEKSNEKKTKKRNFPQNRVQIVTT